MLKERVSQEKGLARIQELTEQFPELPGQMVVHADYVREGVKHTPILDEIGRWAMPDAHNVFEFDYDEHSQQDLVGGITRTPQQIFFGKGKELQFVLDSRSPYEVKYEGVGRYWLYRDGDPIEQVYFLPCPQWFWKKTSSGKPMNQVVTSNVERSLNMCLTTYCEYFKDGNQCLYCNMNPGSDRLTELGQERMRVKRGQDVYEAFLACAQETGVEAMSILAGGFYNRSKEVDLYLRTLEVLKRAQRDSGCQVGYVRIAPQAIEEQDQWRLKEAGATNIQHIIEVWDPKLFEIICPGKAKETGQERWIESLLKAVEIFGWGKVNTNFVIGVELVPPFGFKTEEEGAESVAEGLRFMASHGVTLRNQLFRGRPGAVLAQAPRPRTEYYLRVELERHKLQKEYNLPDPYPY